MCKRVQAINYSIRLEQNCQRNQLFLHFEKFLLKTCRLIYFLDIDILSNYLLEFARRKKYTTKYLVDVDQRIECIESVLD